MNDRVLIDIAKKELVALEDFLKVLNDERDAIVSFSLEGIATQNNRKEDILKRIEYLESEKQTIIDKIGDQEFMEKDGAYQSLSQKMSGTLKEVVTSLEKNKRLLSFSMDHVKTSIENIVSTINSATYGRKPDKLSFLVSEEV